MPHFFSLSSLSILIQRSCSFLFLFNTPLCSYWYKEVFLIPLNCYRILYCVDRPIVFFLNKLPIDRHLVCFQYFAITIKITRDTIDLTQKYADKCLSTSSPGKKKKRERKRKRKKPGFLTFAEFHGESLPSWAISSCQHEVMECRVRKRCIVTTL